MSWFIRKINYYRFLKEHKSHRSGFIAASWEQMFWIRPELWLHESWWLWRLLYFSLLFFFFFSSLLFSDSSPIYFPPTISFQKEKKYIGGYVFFWRCVGEIGCYMDEHLEVDKVSVIVTKEGRQTRQAWMFPYSLGSCGSGTPWIIDDIIEFNNSQWISLW